MLDWITGTAAWLSQGVNKILLNGSPDMTISARCYLNRHKSGWSAARKAINRVFFWQPDHCRSSYLSDLAYAERILAAHKQGDTL